MNPFPVESVIAIVFALILAVWLGRLYRPRQGGLSTQDTREVLTIVIVSSVLIMVAIGRNVPDYVIGWASMAIAFHLSGALKSAARSTKAEPAEPESPVSTPGAKDGSIGLRPLVLLAVAATAIWTLAGCATALKTARPTIDRTVKGVGGQRSLDALNSFRTAEGELFAQEHNLDSLDGAQITEELYDQDAQRVITNNVTRRRWVLFETPIQQRAIAPTPTPSAHPGDRPLPAVEAPSAGSAGQGANNSPPPASAAGTSNTESANSGGDALAKALRPGVRVETRLYQLQAKIDRADPSVFAGAELQAEITISGPAGWTEGTEAVEIAGHVLSVSNLALPIAVGKLAFDGFKGRVVGGILQIDNEAGSDIQFRGTADLASGVLVGQATPASGTAAEAFFVSASLSGQARLVETQIVTNAAPPPPEPEQPARRDAIDLSNAISLGTHAGTTPQRATIVGEMISARIEGGNVRMTYNKGWNEGGSRKGDAGRCYIYWLGNDGQPHGGHYDWLTKDQSVKTLGNIYGGYLGGEQPPHGAEVYFGLLSIDGSKRTTFIKSENNWP